MRESKISAWFFLKLLPLCIIGILTIVLLSGILIPIYSDEIAIHLSHARVFRDGLVITGLFPQCGNSWLRSPRWYQIPAIIIYSIIYPSGSALILRAAGVFCGICIFLLFWFLCLKLFKDLLIRLNVCAFIFSICSFGVLPYLFVLTRSEQLFLICLISLVILVVFYPIIKNESKTKISLKFAIFFSLVSLFYFTHPRTIFFIPFLFIALCLLIRFAFIWQRVLSAIIFIVMTLNVIVYAKNVVQCNEAPGVAKMLSANVVNINSLKEAPVALFTQMLFNIKYAIKGITDQSIFNLKYQSAWIPAFQGEKLSPITTCIDIIIKSALPFFLVCGAILIILIFFWKIKSNKTLGRTSLAFFLIGGIIANMVIYTPTAWNFYTPGGIIPVLALALLLVIPEVIDLCGNRTKYFSALVVPTYVVALASMIILMQSVVPSTFRTALKGDLIIPGQPLSSPIFLNENSLDILKSLAQDCGINTMKASRVVVDGVAYSFLKDMMQPIDVLYVTPIGYGMDIKNLGAFLRSKKSEGVLSRCDYLSKSLIDKSIRRDGMCCLPEKLLH